MIRWTATLCAVAFAAAVAAGAASPDLPGFYEGVAGIAGPGVPGPLSVFGDQAFVVVTGSTGPSLAEPVVAAARYGSGRVVAFGHDGYFDLVAARTGQTARFFANAIRWAAGANERPRVATLQEPALQTTFAAAGITADNIRVSDLAQADVLIVRNSLLDDASIAAVRVFVLRGGGLLIACPVGWGWKQLNPGKDLALDHAGNKLLAEAGIVWTDGYLIPTSAAGFAVGSTPPEFSHAAAALTAAVDASSGSRVLAAADRAQIAAILTHAAIAIPPSDRLILPRLDAFANTASSVVPSAQSPVGMNNLAARLSIVKFTQSFKRNPALASRPHAAAALFPGSVAAGAAPATATISVPAGRAGWISTGLYAAPGALITATLASVPAARGIAVRIGAHSDQLWNLDSWRRMPEITTSSPIGTATTQTANPFGGPVYIEVPGNQAQFDVAISGAVEAPHFILGATDLNAWKSGIRNRPGPWAELEGKNIVLVLPSVSIRSLDDPAALMTFWDKAVSLQDELAGAPNPRTRKERVVADEQISAGYMHSGYPIMTWLDVVPAFADLARMRTAGSATWGIFHELGHNHQNMDWTFVGAGEVTVNLFTLYVYDRLLGIGVNQTEQAGAAARRKYIASYLKQPNFEVWKQDPFLALTMYAEMAIDFGWEPFQRVFAEYLALPASDRPRSDAEKRDQWLIRFSRTVGRNLGFFFDVWAVPTTAAAKAAVKDYPVWLPAEIPADVFTPPPAQAAPRINAGGIAGVAGSFPPVAVISSGAPFSIYGRDFVPSGVGRRVNADEIRDGVLPAKLLGVCVLLGSRRALLLAAFPDQINAVAPDLGAATTVQASVIAGCDTPNSVQSAPQAVAVARAAPEFLYFIRNSDGRNAVAAVNAVTGALIGPVPAGVPPGVLAPARPGDVVTVYAVGFGPTNPPLAAGAIAPGAAKATDNVVVRLGAATLGEADVLYAGAASGQFISQLNIRVPLNTPNGNIPIQVLIGSVPSPAGPFLAIER